MITSIQTIQKNILEKKLGALLVSSAYNIGYLTGFFGISKIEREGYLLVTKNHIYIFASGLNSEAVEKHINLYSQSHSGGRRPIESHSKNGDAIASLQHDIVLVEISPRTPLTKKALAQIIKKEKIKRLGFEKYSLSYAEYERLHKDLKVTLVSTEHLVENLRMIKTTDEVSAIEKACKLGDKAFASVLTKIKPGITEKELAWQLELFIRKNGAEFSFPPIVAFGANSSIPHYVTSDKRLLSVRHSGKRSASRISRGSWTSQDDTQIILLDFGVRIENYCSDMTRTVFFGKTNNNQRRMYDTVLEAQQKAFEHLQQQCHSEAKTKNLSRMRDSDIRQRSFAAAQDDIKIKASQVDKVARTYITSKGFPTIPHSLGHGIGLEVHEPPRLSIKSADELKPGMVFSIEPGIYLPNVGGVRIEDLVVLSSSGPKFLTHAKRELIEV